MQAMRYRQVHMDFHTSEWIPEVGVLFDPEVFAETLAKAHVDSVTCFARCHHGWLYYDSKNILVPILSLLRGICLRQLFH